MEIVMPNCHKHKNINSAVYIYIKIIYFWLTALSQYYLGSSKSREKRHSLVPILLRIVDRLSNRCPRSIAYVCFWFWCYCHSRSVDSLLISPLSFVVQCSYTYALSSCQCIHNRVTYYILNICRFASYFTPRIDPSSLLMHFRP